MDVILNYSDNIHVMAMTLLFVFVVLAVKGIHYRAFKWNLLFLLCFVAYTLRVLLVSDWQVAAHFFNTLEYFIPVLFMFATQANFDDEFEVGRVEWLVVAMLSGLLLVFLFGRPFVFDLDNVFVRLHLTAQYGLAAFCVFWAYWNAIRTWENDLLLLRRRARAVFVFVVGPAILIGIVLYYVSLYYEGMVPYINLYVSLGILSTGFLCIAVFGQISFEQFEEEQTPSAVSLNPKPETQLKDPETAMVDQLRQVMLEDRRYAESDLNLAKLAQYMGSPEYKLRSLINRGLGYRNFNQFLNEYRVGAAKKALEAPGNKVPVLNISLDCGYTNQSTFHKAFKQITGLTPLEYREQHRG